AGPAPAGAARRRPGAGAWPPPPGPPPARSGGLRLTWLLPGGAAMLEQSAKGVAETHPDSRLVDGTGPNIVKPVWPGSIGSYGDGLAGGLCGVPDRVRRGGRAGGYHRAGRRARWRVHGPRW